MSQAILDYVSDPSSSDSEDTPPHYLSKLGSKAISIQLADPAASRHAASKLHKQIKKHDLRGAPSSLSKRHHMVNIYDSYIVKVKNKK